MLASLDVQDWLLSNPHRACDGAHITKPTRLGVGWTNARGATSGYSHGDFSGLPALQIPELPLDLNQGLEDFVPKRLDHKMGVETIIKEAFVAGAPLEECNILTHRKNLCSIFSTVYEPEVSWTVDATCVSSLTSAGAGEKKPILFLDVVKNEDVEKIRSGGDDTPYVAWGYNFGARCTGAPYADANAEYGMLVNFMLEHDKKNKTWRDEKKRFSIYSGAEIDAYVPDKGKSQSKESLDEQMSSIPPMSALREVATFPLKQHPGKMRVTYHYRHTKWWLRCHLAGIPAAVLGARDPDGIVREIHTVPTADFPRISWEHGCRWSPPQSIAFGADVLSWMTGVCQSEDCVDRHVRFEYDPKEKKIAATIVDKGDLPARVTAAVLQAKEQVEENNGEEED
jgi:hypothetical protein